MALRKLVAAMALGCGIANAIRWFFFGGNGWNLALAIVFFGLAYGWFWVTSREALVDRKRERFLVVLRQSGVSDAQADWLKAHWDIKFGEQYIFPLHPDQQAVVQSLVVPPTLAESADILMEKLERTRFELRLAMEGDNVPQAEWLRREVRNLVADLTDVRAELRAREVKKLRGEIEWHAS